MDINWYAVAFGVACFVAGLYAWRVERVEHELKRVSDTVALLHNRVKYLEQEKLRLEAQISERDYVEAL